MILFFVSYAVGEKSTCQTVVTADGQRVNKTEMDIKQSFTLPSSCLHRALPNVKSTSNCCLRLRFKQNNSPLGNETSNQSSFLKYFYFLIFSVSCLFMRSVFHLHLQLSQSVHTLTFPGHLESGCKT